MRPTTLLIAGLTLLCGAALAAVSPNRKASVDASPAQVEVPAHVPPVPLLWKISDQDNAIYLLGSFHMLMDGDYPLSADVDMAFADAKRVIFEVSPDELGTAEASTSFLQAANLPDGRTLSDVLSPRLREKLHRLLARQGGSLDQVNHYSPWYVNLSLALGLSHSLGFDPELGLDQYLMRQALEAGKPTGGLETVADQLHALAGSPLSEQVMELADFLDRPQEMPRELSELHQAWRDGDPVRLDQMTRMEMMAKTPRTYQMINVDRNEAWLPELRRMLDAAGRGNALVVVGAMHLLGEDGVVARLAAHDYTVERICSACDLAEAGIPDAAVEALSLP